MYADLTVLIVLTAFKSLFWCYVMHIPQRCSAAEADLLCWLLSSAAREMHTCTLASYVITREGCTAALLTTPGLVVPAWLGLKSSSVAWVIAWVFSSFVSKKFAKVKFTPFLTL